MANTDRINLYAWGPDVASKIKFYANTATEQRLLEKFYILYTQAKSLKDKVPEANIVNLQKYRKAYKGTLKALTKDGEESEDRPGKNINKMCYEFVESMVDNNIPLPKMTPRTKLDLPLVEMTEEYLKFESNRLNTEQLNDITDRVTNIDGTSWYKIGWDPLRTAYDRAGNLEINYLKNEEVIPQPGITPTDWYKMEYCFEEFQVSATRLLDLYGRLIRPDTTATNFVTVIRCYYLDENRNVNLFMWSKHSRLVICNEEDWQVKKVRTCKICGEESVDAKVCPICGHKSWKYESAKVEYSDDDYYEWHNPYFEGKTQDATQNQWSKELFIKKGDEVPVYRLKQLPFVPRQAISQPDSIYGISLVSILLEMQDSANKILYKIERKVLKSGIARTYFRNGSGWAEEDDEIQDLEVKSAEEAAMFQVKQIPAAVSEDIAIANQFYAMARAASGVSQSYQGQADSTATSGKAKQVQALQAAGRLESLRVMKNAAFAAIYELMFKTLLAYSSDKRTFVKVLADGTTVERQWSKYWFLDKDVNGNLYYRDDFAWSVDAVASLSTNRQALWEMAKSDLSLGLVGNPADSRVLQTHWNIMDQMQYPLAKEYLAGIKENAQHIAPELEQALMQNPEVLQMAVQLLQANQEQRGGARQNSGPQGNGATHAANVERTNDRNRSKTQGINTATGVK